MSNDNGNAGANLGEELTKESQRILNGIAPVPNGGVQNVTHSLDLSGLNPIQVFHAINTINNLKLRNKESEELKRQISEADNLIKAKQQRNRDIDREIQKVKEIAEQQQRQEEQSKESENRFQQSINDCKGRMAETKLEHDRISAELLKCDESTKNNEAQISENARKLTESKEELERLREQVKCQESTEKELLEEERKMQENVEKADEEIKGLAMKRVTTSLNLSTLTATIRELEQQIKEHPEKLQEARNNHSAAISSESAELKEKLAKLQSEYDQIQSLQTQKSEQLITLMNIHELGRQLDLSIDTSAEGDGDDDDMDKEMISKVVDKFLKLQRPFKMKRAEQRKQRLYEGAPSKHHTKKATETETASIPVTNGVPVPPNPQTVEADPRVQPRSESNAVVVAATKERAPEQTSNDEDDLEEGEIRDPPQSKIEISTHPPPRTTSSTHGPHAHPYRYKSIFGLRFKKPRPQPYPRFDGTGYYLPGMPDPRSLPSRRQPPPMRRNFKNYNN